MMKQIYIHEPYKTNYEIVCKYIDKMTNELQLIVMKRLTKKTNKYFLLNKNIQYVVTPFGSHLTKNKLNTYLSKIGLEEIQ